MRVGVFAKTFARPSAAEVLDAAAAHGFDSVQFNLSVLGLPTVPDEPVHAACTQGRELAAASGVAIAAVSGTCNMAHPDPAVRAAGAAGLVRLIEACDALGTSTITLCTGTRDAADMWRAHPDNTSADAWRDMRATLDSVLPAAEAARVTLAFEPEVNNVVTSAADARRLLDEARSPALAVVLDPANLVTAETVGSLPAVLDRAVDALAGDLALAHAKDIDRGGAHVAPGKGVLDYPRYARLLRGAGYDGDVILHGLAEDEVDAARRIVAAAVVEAEAA